MSKHETTVSDLRDTARDVENSVVSLQDIRHAIEDGKRERRSAAQAKKLDKLCLDLGCVMDEIKQFAKSLEAQ